MRKWFQRFRKDDRGVAMIEYGLLAPVMTVLLVGIVDFGNFIHEKMELDDLARDSVQYVLQGGNYNNIQTDVIDQSNIYKSVDKDQLSLTVTPPSQQCECSGGSSVVCTGGTCPSGDYVRGFVSVTITASYKPIITWPGIAANKSMTGFARMQYNW
jgi:Flp pilus assembly protein TadG